MDAKKEEVNMVVSGILGEEKKIRVEFSRKEDCAEFIMPGQKVDKNKGFSVSEIEQLQDYLQKNKDYIMEQARKINPLRDWMKEKI